MMTPYNELKKKRAPIRTYQTIDSGKKHFSFPEKPQNYQFIFAFYNQLNGFFLPGWQAFRNFFPKSYVLHVTLGDGCSCPSNVCLTNFCLERCFQQKRPRPHLTT